MTTLQCWVLQCVNCRRWYSKEKELYGKNLRSATCPYCHEKTNIGPNGRLVDAAIAADYVQKKNSNGQTGYPGFGKFKDK